MAEILAMRRGALPADDYLDAPAPRGRKAPKGSGLVVAKKHELDGPAARKELRQLLEWLYYERDRQATNRLEMALDHDFYDSIQWNEDDKTEVESRGQMALVYNDVAPACDWLIGTERRTRVDWRVLPRAEDDVEIADIKTKVMKYHADVNRSAFVRSRAFSDAVKGGIGWKDAGVRDDPTQDVLYDRYEHWRNVLHDSAALELGLEDGRYLFRWRWVDEDIACMMFPDRADRIKAAASDQDYHVDPLQDEEDWPVQTPTEGPVLRAGFMSMASAAEGAQRRRVKLYECQYRKPAKTKIIMSGPLRGMHFDPRDTALGAALGVHGGTIIDKVMLRMHVAVFLESDMLAMGPSIYRHNNSSLTPVFCYRRNKDGQPYGTIRRVRDIQRDLNKRASKALHVMNTNQLILDEGAVDDIDEARDEAQRPDGVIVKKAGKQVEIRRDTDSATGQLQIMVMDSQSIQRSLGVTDENRGLKTNATSGEAIKARQTQGSVVTTEPFDNLRYATQVHGQKNLSLIEQFYTEEKVVRLTGARGKLDWVKINQPEVQPDGSVRWLNDITATMGDFIVSEQDYSGTMRQVMFDSIASLAQKMPPEVSLRVLTLALEHSDLPNKDDIARELRRITGDRDPMEKLSPEEQQQVEQQMQAQAELQQVQRETMIEALNEQKAKVREAMARADQLSAQADKLRSEALTAGGDPAAAEQQLRQIDQERQRLSGEVERLTGDLAKANRQLMERLRDNDTEINRARIDADARVSAAEEAGRAQRDVAKIQAASAEAIDKVVKRSDAAIEAVLKRLDALGQGMEKRIDSVADQAAKQVEAVKTEAKVAAAAAAPMPTPAPVAAPAPAAEAAPTAPGRRVFTPKTNKAGDIVGGTIEHEDGTVERLTVSYDDEGAIEEVAVGPQRKRASKD